MMKQKTKFKIWDYLQKTWLQVDNFSLDFKFLNDFFIKNNHEIDRYEVVQYTGLPDTNKKEIYSGDVLANKYIDKDYFSDTAQRVKFAVLVGFEKGAFVDMITHNFLWNVLYDMTNETNWTDYEIIGNIYENPELLTKIM